MDFEDLLTGKHREKRGRYNPGEPSNDHHGHHDDQYRSCRGEHGADRSRHEHHFDMAKIVSMVRSLPHFKAILAVAAIGVALILVLGVILLVTLFPLFTRAVGYVSQNGLGGVMDYVLPKDGAQGVVNQVLIFLQRLWKGNG